MKPVVVAKILRASWNYSSAHWLHHPMNEKNQSLILKYPYIIVGIKHNFLCINICWAPCLSGSGFNTSLGAQQTLMYQKSMFDRYYCIKSFSCPKTLEKMPRKALFPVPIMALKGTLTANVLRVCPRKDQNRLDTEKIDFAQIWLIFFIHRVNKENSNKNKNSAWLP